jgi:hypothetical protein
VSSDIAEGILCAMKTQPDDKLVKWHEAVAAFGAAGPYFHDL